jgi:hypothetical protein
MKILTKSRLDMYSIAPVRRWTRYKNYAINDIDPGIRAAITQQLETMNSIALCAVRTRARGLNDAQTCRTAWEFVEISRCYEFNSGLRSNYAVYEAKWLVKLATNDSTWRKAA